MAPFNHYYNVGNPSPFLQFLQSHSTAEWVTAGVLLLQAAIFGLHALILRGHSKSLEKNVEIAESQSKTADLIGQAIQQQGKILEEQTKIMDEQFKFQRRVEAKAERAKVFSLLMDLHVKVTAYCEAISGVQLSTYRLQDRDALQLKWQRVYEDLIPCVKELSTSIHVNTPEREYFLGYTRDVAEMEMNPDIQQVIHNVFAIQNKYRDFTRKLFAAGKTPIS